MAPPRLFRKLAKHFGYRLVPVEPCETKQRDESEYLASHRVRNQLRQSYDKVFCIGSNKTGTTTLEQIFRLYGLKVPNQQTQEREITHVIASGDFSKFQTFIGHYDAFQDLPFSAANTYVACDALFPGSKFILTVRDSETWYNSLVSFHKRVLGIPDLEEISEKFFEGKDLYLHKNYSYEQLRRTVLVVNGSSAVPDWSLAYNKKHYIKAYENRNEEIIKYFYNRPSDLLVIDVTSEPTTARICQFLGLKAECAAPMPHENKT